MWAMMEKLRTRSGGTCSRDMGQSVHESACGSDGGVAASGAWAERMGAYGNRSRWVLGRDDDGANRWAGNRSNTVMQLRWLVERVAACCSC